MYAQVAHFIPKFQSRNRACEVCRSLHLTQYIIHSCDCTAARKKLHILKKDL